MILYNGINLWESKEFDKITEEKSGMKNLLKTKPCEDKRAEL